MLRQKMLVPLVVMCAGCAVSSTIQPANKSKSAFEGAVYAGQKKVIAEDTSGSEQYRVFEQGATGFVSVQTVREAAENRANQFCEKQGKWAKTLTEHTSTPLPLPGKLPRVELVFVCADKTAPSLPSTVDDPRFVKLTNLKKLLDSGVITQEEFEREKQKILREQ